MKFIETIPQISGPCNTGFKAQWSICRALDHNSQCNAHQGAIVKVPRIMPECPGKLQMKS